MTEALASKIAGVKLGGIVAALLIPMLVLSYFTMQSLRREIANTERQLDGIAFNRIVQAVVSDAASGSIEEAHAARLRDEGVALGRRLGLKRELSGALATFNSSGNDKRYVVLPLNALLAEAAAKSGLILDSAAETYHLGAAIGIDAPGVMAGFVQSWTAQTRAIDDGTVSTAELTNLLLATGAWRESQDRLGKSFAAAKAASRTAEAYGEIAGETAGLASYPTRVAKLVIRSPPDELAAQLASAEEFSTARAHITSEVNGIWTAATLRLETLLRDRLRQLQYKLVVMLAVAAAACLTGAGAAALMFRSTLRRLDIVEVARVQAEQARAEAQQSAADLQRLNDDVIRLNRDLSENLEKLRAAQDEAVRRGRLSQLGQLTATVAHELRNPLGAVRTSAFFLERKLKDRELGIEPQLQRINSGITRCDSIITQLLDFARSKALDLDTVDFDSWLEQLLGEEAQRLPAAVSVTFEPGLAGRTATIDPLRMSRVIINLLNNAAEAMVGHGNDPAKAATENPAIAISTAITARGFEVAVRDNGPGMSEQVKARILEPLFTTKSFGTGLGLPAVEKILQEHGGGLEFASQPGEGATFVAWFPVERTASQAA